MNKIRTIVFTIGVISSYLSTQAQIKQQKTFLTQVGIKDSIYSQVLGESRTIFIQLPLNYHTTKNKKYPVAYILDGENFLPTLSDFQSYYSGGFTPEMVLVGISNTKNRTRDLTPSKISKKYGMPFKIKNGEADKFTRFIEKELIPFIDAKYSVTNYKTLIGHSYGGLFTLYTLLNKPYLFTNYLAIDPSLDWDDQKLLKEAKNKLANNNYNGKSLFISLGGQLHMQNSKITIDNVMKDRSDHTLFARSNIRFSEIVKQNKQNGLTFNWKFYPQDLHGTIVFPSIMDGMIATFKWYQMEDTHKINSFSTTKEELLNIIRRRAKKLRDHFGYFEPPYPEELLLISGDMNMDMEQIEKANMYFELAVEYYPKSANTHRSIARFYKKQGDLDKASKYEQKASSLIKKN